MDQDQRDYADFDRTPRLARRLGSYAVSLLVGVVFLSIVCGGTLLTFVISHW